MKSFAIILGAFAALGSAHMRLSDPPALRAPNNVLATTKDYELIKPLKTGQFPCKGYHLDTDGVGSVATWEAGSKQSFTVMGNGVASDIPATHGGGSCQVSFSRDGGATWRVTKSWIGGCVAVNDNSNVRGTEQQGNGKMIPTLDFDVPKDVPNGPILWAWTWFNTIGNREMYMDCASLTISGGASDTSAFDKRPEIFVANVDNGCATVLNTQVDFPNPGDDVVRATEYANPAPPVGTCPTASASGSVASAVAGTGTAAKAAEVVDAAPVASSSAAAAATPEATVASPVVEAATPAVASPSAIATPAVASPSAIATPAVAAAAAPVSASGSAQTGACPATEEGYYSCIDGASFQRCAIGQWTVAQALAQGTACVPGTGEGLTYKDVVKRRTGFSQFHGRRHADRHSF